MIRVLRWGRSAYETDAALALEARLLAAQGMELRRFEGPSPTLAGEQALVVTSGVRVSAAVLDAAPGLGLVLTTTSGYDHIDLDAAKQRGVQVARCPLARRDAVVQSALGMGLSLLRGLGELHALAQAGSWARAELPMLGMRLCSGLRVGVLGCGVIGQESARIWGLLGAEVWRSDPALPDGLEAQALIEGCDVLTLHCALNAQTRGVIGSEALRAMRPGAILLNTARGACVDVEALLSPHRLGGVGLDVFPEEPWPGLARLAAQPRTLLTPHAAGYHEGLGEAVAREVADTLLAFAQGEPLPHPVS